jgi:hypothetical protein
LAADFCFAFFNQINIENIITVIVLWKFCGACKGLIVKIPAVCGPHYDCVKQNFNCGISTLKSLGLQFVIYYVIELLVVPWLNVLKNESPSYWLHL